jgi:DNA-binding GntR family transcriptional regulator
LDSEHQSIADAALGGDGEKAAALLTIHIKETARLLGQSMGAAPELKTQRLPRAG